MPWNRDVADTNAPAPLYASAGGLDSVRGRFLLISYHFPPLCTAGAVRWGRITELAAERGWTLDVIAGHPAQHERTDVPALERLPPGTRVFGVRTRPSGLQRVEGFAASVLSRFRALRKQTPGASEASRAHRPRPQSLAADEMGRKRWDPGYYRRGLHTLALNRGDLLWARDAFRLGKGLSRGEGYQLIISCGPPHMAHEAGRQLAEHTGLPLIMDLRDPWSLERRLPEEKAHPLSFRLARRYERRCVDRADLVVTNTDEVREAMERRYGGGRARFLTVLNGYDELDLPPSPARSRTVFKIAYAGGIYLDRNPETLFLAVQKAVSELGLTPEELSVEMIGRVTEFAGVPTAEIAARCGVRDFVHLHPHQDRDRLWEMLNESSMLVSLPQDSPWAVPSKIYEYMQFNAWLLVMADGQSPIARLLRGSGADVVPPTSVPDVAQVIVRRYREFANGMQPPSICHPRFSRRNQVSPLFDALERVVGSDL